METTQIKPCLEILREILISQMVILLQNPKYPISEKVEGSLRLLKYYEEELEKL